MTREYTCLTCGTTFVRPKSLAPKYCSAACFQAWRKAHPRPKGQRANTPRNPRLLKTCAICGKAFAALPGKTTCSKQCAAILRKRERMPRLDPEAEALHAYVATHYRD